MTIGSFLPGAPFKCFTGEQAPASTASTSETPGGKHRPGPEAPQSGISSRKRSERIVSAASIPPRNALPASREATRTAAPAATLPGSAAQDPRSALTPAAAAARAYKSGDAVRAQTYAAPPGSQTAPAKGKRQKKNERSAKSWASFSAAARLITRRQRPAVDDSMGVFGGVRVLNRTDALATKAERPKPVKGTTYDVAGYASIEQQHPTGQAAALPPKIPAMDFASVYEQMKVVGRDGVERNRFPAHDPVSDTARLKRALLQPPADLDRLGADAPTLTKAEKTVPLMAPPLHGKLMGKVLTTQKLTPAEGVAREPQAPAGENVQPQQQRLTTELRCKEALRVHTISILRAKAYIAKAERNLVDAEEDLARLTNWSAQLRGGAAAESREAVAAQLIFAPPRTAPSPAMLREQGLHTVADFVEAIGTAAAEGADTTARQVGLAAGQLDPDEVKKYVNAYADKVFEDLFVLRDLPRDTVDSLGERSATDALVRVLGPEAVASLRRLDGPDADPAAALPLLAAHFKAPDIAEGLANAMQAAEDAGATSAVLEFGIGAAKRQLEELDDPSSPQAADLKADMAQDEQALAQARKELASAAAEVTLLRRVADLGDRLEHLATVESAAQSYFCARAGRTESAQTAVRADALAEKAGAAVEEIRGHIGAMKAHLQELEAKVPDLEQRAADAKQARRDDDARDAKAMLDALPQYGFTLPADAASDAKAAELGNALQSLYDGLAHRLDLPDGEAGKLPQRASSPLMALTGVVRALAEGAHGDMAAAADILAEMGRIRLKDLTSDDVSPQVRTAAMSLAQVPRGMEILQHLTNHAGPPALQGPGPLSPDLTAVKVFLLAQEAVGRTPPDQPDLLRFRTDALAAARTAAQADDPVAALAALPVAQRGAFHAFRNGMDSNAPGSDYDAVNRTLLDLGRATQQLGSVQGGPFVNLTPFKSLEQAMTVMDATGGPSLRRAFSETLRVAAEQLQAFAVESVGTHPDSYERAALQSLLGQIAYQHEDVDLGRLEVTPDMIARARAVAEGQGLEAAERRPSARTRVTADMVNATSIETRFEALLERASAGETLSAAAVLGAAREAMAAAGIADGASANADEIRKFVDGVRRRNEPSAGVLAMSLLLESALAHPDGEFGHDAFVSVVRDAMSRRSTLPASVADADTRLLRGVLDEIRRAGAEGASAESVLQIAAAGLEGHADAQEAPAERLSRLADAVAHLSASTPHVEEAHVLHALLESLAKRAGVAGGDMSTALAGLQVSSDMLDLAAYRGLARQQKEDDARAMEDRSFEQIWRALSTRSGATNVAQVIDIARGIVEQQHGGRDALARAAGREPVEAPESARGFRAMAAIADDQRRTLMSGRPTTADDFVDNLKYTVANLQWRDRLKMSVVDTVGGNTDRPVSIPVVPGLVSIQPKLILGADKKTEVSFECFMSSPAGPQLVFGTRQSTAVEGGFGFGVSVMKPLRDDPDAPSLGGRAAFDLRARREKTAEDAVSLRIPRIFGQESTLHGKFVDLVEDVFRVAKDAGTGTSGGPDVFLQLLAAQPEVSMGRLTTSRLLRGVEASGEIGASAGISTSRGGFSAYKGGTVRHDKADTTNHPRANITWPTADSTVTTRVLAKKGASYNTPPIHTEMEGPPGHQHAVLSVPGYSAGGSTLRETRIDKMNKRLAEQTYLGGEHYYDLAARGFETKDFKMFRDSVMARLSQWSELAAIRAPAGIAPEDCYALGEKFVLDLIAQGEAIAGSNTTTTAVSFDILFPEMDAQIDHLHREAHYASKRGDVEALKRIDQALEDLFSDPTVRRVALMHVSNTTKVAQKLGVNYVAKLQTTWQGESKATMAQVPQANPIVDGRPAERQPFGRGLAAEVPVNPSRGP